MYLVNAVSVCLSLLQDPAGVFLFSLGLINWWFGKQAHSTTGYYLIVFIVFDYAVKRYYFIYQAHVKESHQYVLSVELL